MMPSSVLLRMASLEDVTIAAKYAWACSARSRSVRSSIVQRVRPCGSGSVVSVLFIQYLRTPAHGSALIASREVHPTDHDRFHFCTRDCACRNRSTFLAYFKRKLGGKRS